MDGTDMNKNDYRNCLVIPHSEECFFFPNFSYMLVVLSYYVALLRYYWQTERISDPLFRLQNSFSDPLSGDDVSPVQAYNGALGPGLDIETRSVRQNCGGQESEGNKI